MINKEKKGVCSYKVVREGNEEVLKINCMGCNITPSLEDSAICMARTMNKLIEVPYVSRVVFVERRNFEYGYNDTQMLIEIANLYNHLSRQKRIFNFTGFNRNKCSKCYANWYNNLHYVISNLLRSDPLGAYVELKRIRREERAIKESETIDECVLCRENYIKVLNHLIAMLERTKLISLVIKKLAGYRLGDRSIYRNIFRPTISPNFMYTRLMIEQPMEGEELDAYGVGGENDIVIYSIPGDIKYLYHLTPPEFKLSEDKYELLELARTVLSEHEPRAEEFIDPERMRRTFLNIGRDLLQELAEKKKIEISYNEIKKLAEILVRYTVGFGLIEILLQDKKVQDITVNSPIGQTPIFIVHEDYDECVTNIIPSREDALSWATKFRLLSGRPLDEADPVLDTELILPGSRARVAVMTSPLSPWGLAYALRRHRDMPWTLPLFVENKMISPLGAGLLSFLVDGARTILIAGTRSSGKTSLLGGLLVEIMRKYRVITVEDTLELPTEILRKIGYNIQPMKVQAVMAKGGTEIPADEGIRTSLRLGDSSLIVGEVRSEEALALYEAMRVGALANVVAGTIHGGTPYGVFDRVVNDLKVPRTSFKATDIIVICNPVKSADGLHKWRRVTQITEVRKEWEEDPLREKGFVDLMRYNTKTDTLEPTNDLMNGDSDVLKAIAGNIKEWAGDWSAMWDNVLLRTKVKETLVNYAVKNNLRDLLEARFVVRANDEFHRVSEKVREKLSKLDSKRIFFEWDDWLKKEIRKRKL